MKKCLRSRSAISGNLKFLYLKKYPRADWAAVFSVSGNLAFLFLEVFTYFYEKCLQVRCVNFPFTMSACISETLIYERGYCVMLVHTHQGFPLLEYNAGGKQCTTVHYKYCTVLY